MGAVGAARSSELHVGVADHFGWAVLVTAAAGHAVVDRRRIELVEPRVVPAPIHYRGQELGDAGTAALVAEVRASIVRAAGAALDELARDLPAPVASLSLRTWPADFPEDIAVLRRVPWEARADAVMYRQALAELAHERGWPVHLYDVKEVLGRADAAALQAPRRALGPPWTKDHRVAFAAAIAASTAPGSGAPRPRRPSPGK